MSFLLYGATGFTGRLVARRAMQMGLRPVLGGRSAGPLEELASELGLERLVFALEESAKMDAALARTPFVLNCAGPFSKTARPLVEGCFRAKRSYVDITGEVAILEELYARDGEAKAAGLLLLPAAGFDVVPSDCVAACLKRKLPGATRLTLAFRADTRVSPGTAATMIEHLGEPGFIRRDGRLVPIPMASLRRDIEFLPGRPSRCLAIPWGDLASAYRSTSIPNIEVYTPAPPFARSALRLATGCGGLCAPIVRALIRRAARGPSPDLLRSGRSIVWGEATDPSGSRAAVRLFAIEPYALTVETALLAARRILDGKAPTGALTPSQAFGEDFVMEVNGVRREDA